MAGAVAHPCLWGPRAEERGWSKAPTLWGAERPQLCPWKGWLSRKDWKWAFGLSGRGLWERTWPAAGRRVAWPSLWRACGPASGGQWGLAGQAGRASYDQERWPQKVGAGGEDMCPGQCRVPLVAWPPGRVLMWCVLPAACLVFRESLQVSASKFVTLRRCVQTPPGHRDLWKLICQRRDFLEMESRQLGGQRARLHGSAAAARPALLSLPGIPSLVGVLVLLLGPVCWEIQNSNEHAALRGMCTLIF